MIVKEVVFSNASKVRIQHNGLVLQRYDEDLEWFYYKIVADVAVVTADISYDGGHYNGGPVVYGGTDDDGVAYIWENINEIAGVSDRAIEVVPVGQGFSLPEGETIFSPSVIDGDFSSWALVVYGGQQPPVLYVKYDKFDEASYKEVTSILSKMYVLPEEE